MSTSFTRDGDANSGGFVDGDFLISFFEEKVYSASYLDGGWVSVSSEGFDMSVIKPGMAIILKSTNKGKIVWSV